MIRRKIFAFRTCLERKGFSSRPLLQTGFQQPRIRIACIIDQSTKSSHATITRLTYEKRTINFYSSAPCARVKRFVMTRIYLENSQRYINQTIDNQLTRRNTTKIKTPMRFMITSGILNMEATFAVMKTTYAVVKITPEKEIQACTG